ncbi:MAG TPA: tetratricopeptide repeat protein [Phenylobacterium sp.]
MALALAVLPSVALAQTRPVAPAPSPEVQAAMKKAEAGDTAPLVKLADSGNSEAQYYAGVLFLFGGKVTPKDAVRGCAYEGKASAHRADAMHLVGMCYQNGVGGVQDKAKAEAAYAQAAQMGFPKSKCALGKMLMADPSQAKRGLGLCRAAAEAGDVDAQVALGDAYFAGAVTKRDYPAARKWYEKAANQHNAQASRRLGEMYANGDGGSKDMKKAMALWIAGEKAGDPLVAILVADQLFAEVTGGRKPAPGTYAFKGGVPVADIKVAEEWYQLALDRDPRPDVKARAKYALSILHGFRTADQSKSPKPAKN